MGKRLDPETLNSLKSYEEFKRFYSIFKTVILVGGEEVGFTVTC